MKYVFQIAAATVLCASSPLLTAAESNTQLAALEAAAGRGDPKAQTELGIKYENAEGVAKDHGKANQLYCEAAREGYAEAQFRLGWAYANGRGVQHDDDIAAALFRMAADRGHEYAVRMLQYVPQQPDTKLPSCLLRRPPGTLASRSQAHVGDGRRSAESPLIANAPAKIVHLVHRLAPEYAVDTQLVLAMIAVESAFNATAVSPKNAQGLMQLIPETAARFGVKRVFNPVENIRGGLAYLRWLLAFFQGDVPLVVAAYNAGERAVEKYRGIPPYAETRDYVKRITNIYQKKTHPYEAGVVDPSPIVAGQGTPRGIVRHMPRADH